MTNNKEQTAVEWFFMTMNICGLLPTEEIVEYYNQAKAMQKQMTIKLYNDYENYLEEAFKHQNGGQAVILSFEEFYEQTYGGNK
jgi:hypothetical protein